MNNKSQNSIPKIDIVLPWVDPSDPVWQREKSMYSNQPITEASKESKFYRDWNTLKYLFRSIEKNMPWINKIHFLTYGHVPEWLNINHPKLIIDKHADFFKRDHAYPVFSSAAIEMNLSSIPGLSEKFIYLNDDQLIVKQLEPDRFFRNNLPVDSLVQDIPRGGFLYRLLRTKDVHPDICKNCIKPLNKFVSKKNLIRESQCFFYDSSYSKIEIFKNLLFNIVPQYYWINPNHTPQPFLKSNITQCESIFKDLIAQTGNSRFKDKHDICVYLFRNYSLVTGSFFPYNYHDTYCMVLSSYTKSITEINKIKDFSIVCINDSEFLSHDDFLKVKPILGKALSSLFPNKSSFEK